MVFAIITIPLYNNLNSIALIIFVFTCVIQQPVNKSLQKLKQTRLWIFPALYVIWLCATWFWDVSGGFAAKDIERYAALLFLPPAMALVPRFSAKQIQIACLSLVSITIIVSLICLAKSYSEYLVTKDYRVFFYHYLGMQMNLNAIFLSNYCLVSIACLLYFGFIHEGRYKLYTYPFILPAIAFLFTMIFLLSSKLLVFITLIVLVFFILYIGYLKGYLLRSVVLMVIITVAGLIAARELDYLSWRISSTTVKEYSGKADDNNGIAIRLLMWESAWELIKERPVLGYGVRGARESILEKFREKHFEMGYRDGYHSHNQYLESTLMGGIPAFVLLMGMLAGAFIRGLTTRNILLLLLLLLFMTQSIIESAFEVQQELVFYIFFIFLFAYHSPSTNNPTE